jgi:hypothetical protein
VLCHPNGVCYIVHTHFGGKVWQGRDNLRSWLLLKYGILQQVLDIHVCEHAIHETLTVTAIVCENRTVKTMSPQPRKQTTVGRQKERRGTGSCKEDRHHSTDLLTLYATLPLQLLLLLFDTHPSSRGHGHNVQSLCIVSSSVYS